MYRRLPRLSWLPALLPLIAAVGLYAHTITFEYVRWDDPQLITDNPLIRSFSPRIFWSYDPELYIPFTLLTYQIDMLVAGGAAWMAHAVNVALHGMNAFLVYLLLRRLADNRWAAAGAATLFAVHPLTVEAVAWASGRKELLWTLWSLVTTLLLLRGNQRWPLLTMLLASLSKPTAVVTPLLARIAGAPWKKLWGTLAIAALTLLIAFGGKAEAAAVLSPLAIAMLGIRSIADVLGRVVWPWALSPLYTVTLPVQTQDAFLPGCVILGCVATCWALRQRIPLLWSGFLWFLAALAPSLPAYLRSNEVQLAADRYAYMPLIGIAIATAGMLALSARRTPRMCTAIMAAIIALLSIGSVRQALLWSDSSALFLAATERTPQSAVAWNNRADGALDRNDLSDAERSASQALLLRPEYADALANMGAVRARQERYDEAEDFLLQALILKPDHFQATFNLAGTLWKRGRLDEALVAYRRALEIRPDSAAVQQQVDRVQAQLAQP